MKKILVIMVMAVFIGNLSTGCSKSKFVENYEKFNESFMLATDYSEKGNDLSERLKLIDKNLIETELPKMKQYLDFMGSMKNNKGDDILYNNSKGYLNDVENLLEIIRKIDDYNNISEEEKLNFFAKAITINQDREFIKGTLFKNN